MVRLDFSIDEREVKEAEEVKEEKEVEDAEHPPPPPRVFWQKSPQAVENKERQPEKERKER